MKKSFNKQPVSLFIMGNGFENNTKTIIIWHLLFLCFIVWVIQSSCKNKPSNALEPALCHQDWKAVFEACKKDDSLLKKPETVGILGHTFIMLNKNNESYILLKSLDFDSSKRKGWQTWTDAFVQRYPNCAIAHYFQGDAYMRNGNKEKAISCFSKALKKDPKCALVLNARGTVYASSNKKELAIKDFNAACKHDQSVAEFFVSRGTWFFNSNAHEGAFSDFSHALKLAPSYALALNGIACSMLYSSNHQNKGNIYDSVGAYFYLAEANIKLPFIKVNSRNMLLEVENKLFPALTESPLFRSSDFLDWDLLKARSNSNPSDVLRFITHGSIPTRINADFLMQLNNALLNSSLFDQYLKQVSSTDSILAIVSNSKKEVALLSKPEEEKILILNRLILEGIYKGLIASFHSRNPGMNLLAQSGPFANKMYLHSVPGEWRIHGYSRDLSTIFSPSGVDEIPAQASASKLAEGVQITSDMFRATFDASPSFLASTTGPGKRGGRGGRLRQPEQRPPNIIVIPPGQQPRPGPKPGSGPLWPPTKPQTPDPNPSPDKVGGAIADTRRSLVDNNSKLFICFYSLY